MTEDELMGLVILSVYGIILIIIAISALLTVIGNWRLFEKAGQNGWYAIIPFYGGFINTKLLLVKQTSGYILLVGFLPFTMLILTFAMSEHLVAQKVWQY